MKRINEYIIPIQGLAEGKHEFDFKSDGHLLNHYSNSNSYNADIDINISLLKKNNMYDMCFKLNGSISLECDRCLEIFNDKIDKDYKLIIKHSEKTGEHVEGSTELRFIGHDCSQVNLAKDIYEYIQLSLPIRKLCNSKNCSEFLEKYSISNTNSTKDPRWEKLSKLK